jgi:hypothetical protein
MSIGMVIQPAGIPNTSPSLLSVAGGNPQPTKQSINTVAELTESLNKANADRINLYSDDGYQDPVIVGAGFSADNPADWWQLNGTTNSDKMGIYTLMKIDTDRWLISGPDLDENYC